MCVTTGMHGSVSLGLDSAWQALLVMLLLLLANGLFVAVEFALISVRRSRIHELVQGGHPTAKIVDSLQRNLDFSVAGAQLGITIASLALGWAADEATQLISRDLARIYPNINIPPGVGFFVSFLVLSMSHVILGEQVPKSWALRTAEQMALLLAVPFRLFCTIMWPLIAVMNRMSDLILRAMRIPKSHESAHAISSPEEFQILFEQSKLAGKLEEDERLMLHRSLSLREVEITRLMVPSSDIDWLDLHLSKEELVQRVEETPHTRLVIADGTLDDPVGYVNGKEILACALAGREIDLVQLAHKILVLPESRKALLALKDFRETQTQVALVMDEYGSVRGMVTINDVVTAVMGSMVEPHDNTESIIEIKPGVWVVDGATSIDDLFYTVGHFDLPHSRVKFHTVAGLILSELGAIPQAGTAVRLAGYQFEVLEMENYRIARVRVTKLPPNLKQLVASQELPLHQHKKAS